MSAVKRKGKVNAYGSDALLFLILEATLYVNLNFH